MNLSATESKILSVAHLNANCTVREIHKETGIREYTVRDTLLRLRRKGIIKISPIINVYRLGLAQYGVFFSLSGERRVKHSALIKKINGSDHISFLCELGGDFQYEMTVCGKSLFDVSIFLDEIAAEFGNIVAQKAIAARISLIDYRSKYLFGNNHRIQSIAWGACRDEEHVDVDDLDRKILSALSKYDAGSQAEMARVLKIPYSTLDYRLRAMEKSKVIEGYRYLIDTTALGYHSYLILVYVRGMSATFGPRLREFCRKNDLIRFLVQNVGGWDYELGLESKDPRAVVTLTQSIFDEFGEQISGLKMLPVFSYVKVVNFPFEY